MYGRLIPVYHQFNSKFKRRDDCSPVQTEVRKTHNGGTSLEEQGSLVVHQNVAEYTIPLEDSALQPTGEAVETKHTPLLYKIKLLN